MTLAHLGEQKKLSRYERSHKCSKKRKIHILHRTVTSLKKRVRTLDGLITHLKKKSYKSESSEDILKIITSLSSLKIFERLLKGPSTQNYDPAWLLENTSKPFLYRWTKQLRKAELVNKYLFLLTSLKSKLHL
nr:unnamed protein product [Callosobruchus analis]